MGENKQHAEKVHEGLSANLYQFQSQFHELLPDFHLQSGEVQKIGDYPVRGTATMDIYEGLYLGKEKVAIKVLRSLKFDEQSKRVRIFCPLFLLNMLIQWMNSVSHAKLRTGERCGSKIEDGILFHSMAIARWKDRFRACCLSSPLSQQRTQVVLRCMISPWQKNGDVLTYVKANDKSVDYIKFVSSSTISSVSHVDRTHRSFTSLEEYKFCII